MMMMMMMMMMWDDVILHLASIVSVRTWTFILLEIFISKNLNNEKDFFVLCYKLQIHAYQLNKRPKKSKLI